TSEFGRVRGVRSGAAYQNGLVGVETGLALCGVSDDGGAVAVHDDGVVRLCGVLVGGTKAVLEPAQLIDRTLGPLRPGCLGDVGSVVADPADHGVFIVFCRVIRGLHKPVRSDHLVFDLLPGGGAWGEGGDVVGGVGVAVGHDRSPAIAGGEGEQVSVGAAGGEVVVQAGRRVEFCLWVAL